jgi:hypothetical protein
MTVSSFTLRFRVLLCDASRRSLFLLSPFLSTNRHGIFAKNEGFEINSKDPYVLDDESFEKSLLDLNSSDTEVTGDGNDINGKENNLHSSFAVDADFEKALMGLNLDDDKDELSDESKKDGAS